MSDAWRRRWRRLRLAVGALLATVLIALAAAMALGQLLLPLLQGHPQAVARLLSSRLHEPVSLATVRGEWRPSGPLLSATDLRIGSGAQALELPAAQLKINFGAWFQPDVRWLEVRVRGMEAHLRRDASGWHLVGLGGGGGGRASPPSGRLGELPVGLRLTNFVLYFDDAVSGRHMQFHADALRAISEHGVLRLGARVALKRGAPAVDIRARFDSGKRDARLYLAGRGLDLAAWSRTLQLPALQVQSGRLQEARVWLHWQGAQLHDVSASLALEPTTLAAGSDPALAMPGWQGRIEARREDGGWRAALIAAKPRGGDADTGGGRLDLRWQPQPDGSRLDATAQALDVAQLAPWLVLVPQVAAPARHWLAAAQPVGHIDALRLHWRDRQHFRLQATLRGIGFKAAAGRPGISGFDARLRGDAEALALELPGHTLSIDSPGMFRKPFTLSRIAGSLVLWPQDGGWQVATPGLDLAAAAGFDLRVEGRLAFAPGASPLVDVGAVIRSGKVSAAKLFWPINIMPPETVAWLDRALIGGTVAGARVIFRGHVADWPFARHQGRFEADATVTDAALDYDPKWPGSSGIDAHVRFVNTRMDVEVSHADVMGNTIDSARATIADMAHAPLLLKVSAHGPTDRMLAYMRKTPVGGTWKDALDVLRVTGNATVGLDLSVPLHGEDTPVALDGSARLQDVRFSAPAWSLVLEDVAGEVGFTASGFASRNLHATYGGRPVSLKVTVGDAVADPAHQLEARMDGRLDAGALLDNYAMLKPLAGIVHGDAGFSVKFAIDAAADLASGTPHLVIDSDLRGLALDLPAPLHKQADSTLPLHLEVELPFAGHPLALTLGHKLSARVRLASAQLPMAADIALGGPAAAPPASGIVIHGHAEHFDVSGWIRRAFAAGSGSGAGTSTSSGSGVAGMLREADLVARHMDVFGRSFDNLAMQLQPQPDRMVLTLAGEEIEGSISIPSSDLDQRGITVRLQRLYWPEEGEDAAPVPASAASAATAGSVAVAAPGAVASAPAAARSTPAPAVAASAAPAATAAAMPAIHMAPSAVPPLHVWVGDLRLGEARLGETRLESYPTQAGMHIEELETHSPDVQVAARGDWLGDADANRTHLVIDFSSADLGRMLEAFGYPGLVAGGATLAHIDGHWPGAPTGFALADLTGSMQVKVSDGRILNVNPGVGRLFGLFSIRELPRRLSLDFGDLFESGFSFNSISGHFIFADGEARTDDLTIRSPAALIRVHGRTGLRARDYDQTIDVTPHVGSALPVVGAIAGGPIGAAAGLAVQQLLGKGLGRAVSVHYRITGSWDHPVITAVSRNGAPAKPAVAASTAVPLPPAASSVVPPVTGSTLPPMPPAAAPPPAAAGSVPAAARSAPATTSPAPASAASQAPPPASASLPRPADAPAAAPASAAAASASSSAGS
ncbi:MAG TPA: YhdP family protein [Rhodanobacteraceae bacterium]|nr:YhdP family protein [Rhodanobacteraceae bacterium]